MKRFYVAVTKERISSGYEIHLDGKPVKIPSGASLSVPSAVLADAVILEWAGQEKEIVPDSMPLTQFLITAQDRVARERAAMEKAVLAYLDTDLLCYRAVLPAATARRQAELWDPWLDWFENECGAKLLTTESLSALAQPEAACKAVKEWVSGLDDLHFTALQVVVGLCGSLVLGMAFIKQAITPEHVYEAALAEESFKASVYGEEKHGAAPHEEKRRAAMMRDLQACRQLLDLLKS